ncbi:hypothetical protein P280DRAFT_545870 [Massarina eburnea CBS 473.64]|uniref:Pre-mRNA-splicing factor n=1 Tax=Massarina eburnea CBS 473.64 TaxID=1395130 RepID=A0A6A6SDY6_9PLEO|nr:hypothetical protein P280DRAFT_545870 [Massarina eburnea CBS 473.64]
MAAPKAGGFKLSLGGAKAKAGLKAPLEKLAKRPRFALGEDEAVDDDKKQEITGWDAAEGGAVDANAKKEEDKGPRIIPVQPNHNWREEARKRKLARSGAPPGQAQNGGQYGDGSETVEEPKQYGLIIHKKEEGEDDEPEPMDTTEDNKELSDDLTEEQRLEKNALDALLHGKVTDHTVIPIRTEEEAYQNDMLNAPDAPTLDVYEATPIEGFGAALLRGMGWKDGMELGKDNKPAAKPKEVKRRPALLGIGAKEEAAAGIDAGGKNAQQIKRKKMHTTYTPVALRNKITGEIITEDELKKRSEQQKMVDEEKPSKSGGKYKDNGDEGRKRSDRKERDRRDDDYDSERRKEKHSRRRDHDDDHSDRERRHDKSRRRDRDRDRDDHYDSERRRDRKRRDRTRSPAESDRLGDRKFRSRSPGSRDRKRDRREDRDSRDSDDRRKRRRENYDGDERDERKRRFREREREGEREGGYRK